MIRDLIVGHYKTAANGTGDLIEQFDGVENVGIRWNIERYGIERIEVTIRTKSREEQYTRMRDAFGGEGQYINRIAIYDNSLYFCVSGYVVGVRPDGDRLLTYIAKGVFWRHNDLYAPSDLGYAPTDTTSDLIKQVLADDMVFGVLTGSLANIDETSTALGGWSAPPKIGMRVSDIIEYAKRSSDSSGNVWDYYCIDQPLYFSRLLRFTPYFKNRNARTEPDWKIRKSDMSKFQMDASFAEFRSKAIVWWGTRTGTATGGTANSLVDASATFLDGRFTVGDEVKNVTDGSVSRIRAITNNTTLALNTLTGGSANTFAVGNTYSIVAKEIWEKEETAAASSAYLEREIAEVRTDMTQTQASQYADALYTRYGQPIQAAAFNLTAPYVRDENESEAPLWLMIFKGGGVIQIDDLYPSNTVTLSQGTNNRDTFFIQTLDYDAKSNSMRVSVNVKDSRLDARLFDAGIIGSEMIARAG